MRLFVADLRKLGRRLATWLTFGILIALMLLIFIAVGASAQQMADEPEGQAAMFLLTFPGAYDQILAFILGLGGLLAVVYAAAIAGSEWTWGTLKSAVARGESRSRYVLASFASVALVLGIGLLLAFAIGIGAAVVGANLAGISTSGIGDAEAIGRLPEQLARGWLAMVEQGGIGFAIATLTRSQLAGIGVGIALYFAEQFASIFFSDIVQYLPFDAASAVVATDAPGGPGGGPIISILEPNAALAVVVAWLIGSLLAAALFTERAEIGG